MKLFLQFILVSVVLGGSSCNRHFVKVRFRNDSPEDFALMKVKIKDSVYQFQNIQSGKHTHYVKVANSYPYCSMQVITRRDTIKMAPAVYLDRQLSCKGKIIMSVSIKPFRYKKQRLLDICTKKQPF